MKLISILRHAKSSWDDPQLDDVDRPLNMRGWATAKRLGREFERRGISVDQVLASPAVRVRETLAGVGETFDLGAPIRFDQRLYLASADQLMAIVHDFPPQLGSPMLVGHNPGLEQLLAKLAGDDELGLRSKVAHKFPTGAFARVELNTGNWKMIEPGRGRIVELILPKELD